jgi:hypothetical protein
VVLLVECKAVLDSDAIGPVRLIDFGSQLIVAAVSELSDSTLLVEELQHDVGIVVSARCGKIK